MATYKRLSPIPAPLRWVLSNGTLTQQAIRWLNDLRDLFQYSFISTVSWSPAQVAANTTAEEAVTVTGVLAGDHVSVSPPDHQAGVVAAAARASDTDEVSVTFVNPTAGAVTPTSGSYVFKVTRP